VRLHLTVATTTGAGPTDVAVELADGATVDTLETAVAARTADRRRAAGGVWLGTRQLPAGTPLEASGVHDGVLIGLGAAPPDMLGHDLPPGLQLHVIGGPDAGRAYAVQDGTLVLGRGSADVVELDDPRVSRRHAALNVSEGTVSVEDLGSRNGTTVDGVLVAGPVGLELGQLLRIGDSLLTLVQASDPDAALAEADDCTLTYNRPPRLLPPPVEVAITLPEAPRARERRDFPFIAIALPLVFGVVAAVVSGSKSFLLFTALSPLMIIGNTVQDRRRGGKQARQEQADYEIALSQLEARTSMALDVEQRARRAAHPDAAEALLIALGPRRRLWERRRVDADFLSLRVGMADQPARARRVDRRGGASDDDGEELAAPMVPVELPLPEVGVLGVAGSPAAVRGLGRWLIGQVAVLHSPRDVSVVVLTPHDADADWSWLRWLPHARPSEGQDALITIGNDTETTATRVAELVAIVKARQAAAKDAGLRAGAASFAAVVVVLDGARHLRVLPGVAQVLREGPSVGVYSICLDAEQKLLPEECSATVSWSTTEAGLLTVERTLHAPVKDAVGERVAAAWSEQLARELAPIRDISAAEDDSGLPTSARLLELLALDPPSPDSIRAGWLAGGRTTRAVIGAGIDGSFAFDLRRDGPHGLIAGTTGAGKSELLQTIVASLATANRPDAMTFVLVDYKGGSAFKDCVHLPHTVGMVTDLDNHLVERALVSLSAELRRREHQLAAVGAKDIEDYTELVDRQSAPPLPRLLLVIDEFASMVRELPDFVTGLVNIAQRGRSLGIHLLLATQRPSGVVSPEIRANTNLRIALRVTDPAESIDVIDAADAARISKSTPGRGYVRLAHSTLLPFQAGRVGGRAPGRMGSTTTQPFVAPITWADLGRPAPRRPASREQMQEVTDLSLLVQAVQQAAEQAQLPAQRRPWLPALPSVVLLDELGPASAASGATLPAIPFGIEDLPDEQLQRTATLPLEGGGHLFAIGASRSGRSQLLRTLAASIGSGYSTGDVHVYGLDCGNGALMPLAALPHCGAIVQRSEAERAARLLGRLQSELERRQSLLASSGFADIDEARRATPLAERLPHIVVLIDRWEGFTTTLGEVDGGRLLDVVLVLLREGPSAGLHVVITGDRSLLSGRISATTEDKIAFRLADRGDVTLLGLNPRSLPDEVAPGRAFRAEVGTELQVALLTDDPSGQAQAAVLTAIAAAAAARDAGLVQERRPFRVDVLPARLSFEQAWELRTDVSRPMFALVGVGGDELTGLGPDFAKSAPAFIVAGPAKSGRSTVLVTMTRSLLAGGSRVALACPRPSPLRALGVAAGVVACWTGPDLEPDELEKALSEARQDPFVLVIDDGELLKECQARELLRALVKGERGPERALVLGGSSDDLCTGLSNWQVDARKARQGALLSPQGLSDGDLIGVRVPRSSIGGPVQPGRALLHAGDGRLLTVQVPLS
jgi:S-DNA-T family DNA segregation ATPase FtsK/SpoIIIE